MQIPDALRFQNQFFFQRQRLKLAIAGRRPQEYEIAHNNVGHRKLLAAGHVNVLLTIRQKLSQQERPVRRRNSR